MLRAHIRAAACDDEARSSSIDLFADVSHAPFSQMDVQGFECRAIDGMHELLGERKAVQAIVTEVSQPHLAAQGCSPDEMLNRLRTTFGRVDVPIGRHSWSYDVSAIAAWRSQAR